MEIKKVRIKETKICDNELKNKVYSILKMIANLT